MGSGDRFYQLMLDHRPALWGDVGSLLKIEGIVVGGEGAQAVLLLPGSVPLNMVRTARGEDEFSGKLRMLSVEEWSDWLQRSDNPEVLVPNPDGSASLPKVFHRKLRYEVSGAVQQKVWIADGCKCYFCGVSMGKAQLTIDHFVPLEQGGANDPSNYLSACRKCNKRKGGMDPRDFCGMMHVDYDMAVNYLKNRKLP